MINNPIIRLLVHGPFHLTRFLLTGNFDHPRTLIVEITNKCNLDCPFCFQKNRRGAKELTDEEWERKLKIILTKNPGITRVIWTGGEPMLRFNLIKKLSGFILFNTILTNGIIPLKKAPRADYWVSIDGTKELHEKLRRVKYDRIKRNIEEAKARVLVNCLLSRANTENIEEMVNEWIKVKNVKGIKFTLFTPGVMDKKEDGLWLRDEERDKIIEKLNKLAGKYPAKLRKSVANLKKMRDLGREKSAAICRKHPRLCLNSSGNELYRMCEGKKAMCVHPEAECSRCGHNGILNSVYRHKNKRAVYKEFFADCKKFLD